MRIHDLSDLSAYLRRVVIITPSLGDLAARSEHIPEELLEGSLNGGDDRNYILVYWTRRSKTQQQEAIKAFKALNYRIIDFTTKNSWEPVEIKANAKSEDEIIAANTPPAPIPVLPGYKPFHLNRRAVSKGHNLTDIPDNVDNYNVVRLIEPDAIVFKNQWGNFDDLARFTKPMLKFLRQQYGHRVAVVDNRTRYKNALKKGVKPMVTLLLEDVYKHFQTSEAIRTNYHIATTGEDDLLNSVRVRRSIHGLLFKMIAFDPYLSKTVIGRTFYRLTGNDYFWLQIWEKIQERVSGSLTDEQNALVKKINDLVATFPYREAHLSRIQAMANNHYLLLLDLDTVVRAVNNRSKSSKAYLLNLHTRLFLRKTLKGNL